jgi:hypothetical protein
MWGVAVVVLQWASVAILAGAVVALWISWSRSGPVQKKRPELKRAA